MAKKELRMEPKIEGKSEASEGYVPRLKERYHKEIVLKLMEEFSLTNPFEVPRLEKIVVNMGVGDATQDPKNLEKAMDDLAIITGQRPLVARAKKSIAGFKVRRGTPIGCKVTLRGNRMYEFLDRLLSTALPRIRDFRGFSKKSFDGFGNYTFGVDEQLIFPEIDYDKVSKVRGMDITIVTTAKDDSQGYALLKCFEFPFRER